MKIIKNPLSHLLALGLFLFASPALAAISSDLDFRNLEVDVLGSASQVDMGQYAEVGKLRVSNRSGRNLSFDSLRLRNYGSSNLDKSFENVNLTTTTGEVLAELVSASSKYWVWQFADEVTLPRGDSLILSVKARLIYARRGETVELGIRRTEDLSLIDKSSGFNVACSDCQGLRLKEYGLDTGGVYITRQPIYRASNYRGSRVYSGEAYERQFANTRVLKTNSYRPTSARYVPTPTTSQQYSPGAKEVVFFSSRLSSRTGIAVDGLFINVGSGSSVTDKDGDGQNTTINDINVAFENWRLLINGVAEGYSSRLTEYNDQIGVLFDNSFDIPANGQIVLMGRITNQAESGDKVRFGLSRSGLIDPQYLSTGRSTNNINGSSSSNYSSVR